MDKIENLMKPWDEDCLREAIQAARDARANGNHPFGAILADENGKVLMRAENTVLTERDCTGHAETNLVREACKRYKPDLLATCTIYASTEPCPMCAGAIFWANIGRVVYGLSEKKLYEITGSESKEVLAVPCKEMMKRGKKDIEVIGPIMEAEALEVHKGFWD